MLPTFYRRDGKSLRQSAELSVEARDFSTGPSFPGLEIPLFDLFP